MNDQLVAPATPLELATEHVHDAMLDAWNDPNPPREEAGTEATRRALSAALDVEGMARIGYDVHPLRDASFDNAPDVVQEWHRAEARALRASILGGTQ